MLTRANKVVETRDMTWEATLSTGAPSPPLPEMPEKGGTVDLEEALEPGGMDVYESAPTTPLPVLGRGIPHQLRAVSPMTQAGGDSQAESEGLNDSSTVSSETPKSDTSSRDDDDSSSSDAGAPTPTAIRTAARQLGAHMSEPSDGEEIREGNTRAPTRVLNREAATGLISTIVPCEGGRIFHALLAAQDTGGERTRLPDCLLEKAQPEPMSYSSARSSINYGVWVEAMQAEFDGLEAADTFTETSEVLPGRKIVESKWLLKWKGDENGTIDGAKARLVAKGYSQVEGVSRLL